MALAELNFEHLGALRELNDIEGQTHLLDAAWEVVNEMATNAKSITKERQTHGAHALAIAATSLGYNHKLEKPVMIPTQVGQEIVELESRRITYLRIKHQDQLAEFPAILSIREAGMDPILMGNQGAEAYESYVQIPLVTSTSIADMPFFARVRGNSFNDVPTVLHEAALLFQRINATSVTKPAA